MCYFQAHLVSRRHTSVSAKHSKLNQPWHQLVTANRINIAQVDEFYVKLVKKLGWKGAKQYFKYCRKKCCKYGDFQCRFGGR